MSKLIRVIDNEIIELIDVSKANAVFQTHDYPEDELFYKLRTQVNVFDLYYENQKKDKEITRLNNIIEQIIEYIEYSLKNKDSDERMILQMVLARLKVELKEGKE